LVIADESDVVRSLVVPFFQLLEHQVWAHLHATVAIENREASVVHFGRHGMEYALRAWTKEQISKALQEYSIRKGVDLPRRRPDRSGGK
jgi:hypothetical protein